MVFSQEKMRLLQTINLSISLRHFSLSPSLLSIRMRASVSCNSVKSNIHRMSLNVNTCPPLLINKLCNTDISMLKWQIPYRKFSSSRTHYGSNATVSSSLFFPEFPTIQAAESVIQFIHGVTGLPWWSTIILTAFFMRMILPLPLTAYSMHNAVRLQKLEPEIKSIALQLRGEISKAVRQFNWDKQKAKGEYIKNMKRHVRNLYIRDNCHPMKDTATFWLHIPLWLSMSYALRNMASRAIDPSLENHVDCETLTREGAAWFLDLTQTDSTWLLPLLLGTISLCNFELHRSRVSAVTTYQRALTFGLRTLALVFIPISASMPAGLVLYWVSSGLFATVQSVFVVRTKWFRHLIRLPDPSKRDKTSSSE